MKLLFIILFISFFAKQDTALAQAGLIQGANDPSKADLKVLNSEGRLTHIVIAPQEKTMGYYLVGTKEGEINFNNLKLFSNQMSPIPDQYPEAKQRSSRASSSSQRSKALPIVKLRPLKHNFKIQMAQRARLPLPAIQKSRPASITPAYVKRTSGFSDMAYILIFLLLLFIAAYA